MALSSIGVTAGTDAQVETYQVATGRQQQTVREAPATAVAAPTSWTIANTSAASVVAADASRRMVILTSPTTNTATVYVRYDAGTVTAAANGWHDVIFPGGRLVVEKELATMAISMIGTVAAGYVEILTATAA